jgi:GDP-L-fucose synthase
MDKSASLYIAGHRGLVGSALTEKFRSEGFSNIITRTHQELDLLRQADVERFFQEERPEYVIVSAARVGGIKANSEFPADFLYENLMIASNVIHAAYESGVKKLLYLGSSCIYPRSCPQPMKESNLLTGPLEPTNEGYAVAKIAGMKLCEKYASQYGARFISAMPTNIYGPRDNYDPDSSHVISALIRKFHEAKASGSPYVEVWGTGAALREFLYCEDLADALYEIMLRYEDKEFINVGSGHEVSIRELAVQVKCAVGYEGEIRFDVSKPDGMPRKLLDLSKLEAMGWRARTSLSDGLAKTYAHYVAAVAASSAARQA